MSDTREVIGFVPILKPKAGSIVTQAFIQCSECKKTISTVGGPRTGALCVICATKLMALPSPPEAQHNE